MCCIVPFSSAISLRQKKIGLFRVPWPKKLGSVGQQFFFFAKHSFGAEIERSMNVGKHQNLSKNSENTVSGSKLKQAMRKYLFALF